jgi:hypothetical protein
MLDDEPVSLMGVLGNQRFKEFTVPDEDDGAIQLLDSESRPFNNSLGGIIPPHGVNCDLHYE